MLRLSVIIHFNISKFSSNNKLGKGKLNKKWSLFKKFLELHLLLGFLRNKKHARKLGLNY